MGNASLAIRGPTNPNYNPNRGVWNPDVGGAAPYQEKVFGWMEFPGGMWEPVELAYPNPGDVGASGSPGELPEPSCASPTDCDGASATLALLLDVVGLGRRRRRGH